MSTAMENNNNNEIMTSNSNKGGFHGISAKQSCTTERTDFDLNEPLISTSLEAASPRIDLNLVSNSQEVSSENNCFMAMGGSQPRVQAFDFLPLGPPTKFAEDMESSNANALVKFPFNLNVEPYDDNNVSNSCSQEARALVCGGSVTKKPPTCDETKFPLSVSADNIEQLKTTPESDVPPMNVNEDRATIVEGGSVSQSRKRKRVVGRRAFRGQTVTIRRESKEKTVMEDGYCWQKYGQKIIKGHLYPRAYYKCKSAGCFVKKHVERDSCNKRIVLSTYEGIHNHKMPNPPMNTTKIQDEDSDSDSDEDVAAAKANGISNFGLPGNLNIPNPAGFQVPYLALGSATNQQFPTGFFMPNNNGFGSLYNNINIGGSSSTPHMQFPSLNNANTMFIPSRSDGLNLGPYATPQPGPPIFPGFPTAPPPPPFNFPFSTGDFTQVRFNGNGSGTVFPFQDSRDS